LIQIGGFYHPISPNEIITVTFNLIDSGDNLFDSAVFIDNLLFAGYATNNIIARNSVEDLNGGDVEIGDILEYSILLTNTGIALQNDYNGSEFENHIPNNSTFINGSARASTGNIIYDQVNNNISWNGEIPGETTIVLKYNVSINQNVSNDALIFNQGISYWDSDGFVGNDAREYTDDPNIDDGVDLDDDGMTLDDDPLILRVICYENPSFLLEDFSDDTPGDNASDVYFGRRWFDTNKALFGNIFEVSENYKYLTSNSFKTKIRINNLSQYWNYSFNDLNNTLKSWEIWFRCGNTSEDSDMLLFFRNGYGEEIIKLKFEYIQTFIDEPIDWVLKLSFQRPNGLWSVLYSDYDTGYLYDSWYKLKIQDYGDSSIIYTLNRTGIGEVCNKMENNLGEPLRELTNIEWISTKNPVVCPIFFWDEHKIGLINN